MLNVSLAVLLALASSMPADGPAQAKPPAGTEPCSAPVRTAVPDAERAGQMKALCLWADEQGISHVREIAFDMQAVPQGGMISRPLGVQNLWFRRSPPAQDFGWHQAPRRQLVITLGGGTAEMVAGDGERRLVKPGDIVIVEDTFGQGHKTRAFDGLPRDILFIELDP